MNQSVDEAGGAGPSQRNVEVGVAILIALIAVFGIIGSLRVGIGWASDGPRAGFFPFYVSLIVLVASAFNIVSALTKYTDGALFAQWAQLTKVLQVFVPTAVYAFAIPYTGVYVASALLIALFMRWFGRYTWPIVAAVSIAMPVAIFITFEIWFLVPLPKGPLEHGLGF